ncbi:MAG: sigma-70 family RNA polymerase sigma factor [Gemmataceae bacterium]
MPTSPIQGVLGRLRRASLPGDDAASIDGQLLEGFVSRRDEAAFARLVQRHGPMVFGVCQRVLRNRHDAEDAFQATFIVLARKSASIHPGARLGSWLYGVAYRTALEARRLAARRLARERPVEEMSHPTVEPEELWHDLQPVLDEELSRLPDKHRLPIVLCDLEGRTRKEVARLLGLPEGTLSNRLAAARQALARRLTGRGLALPCGAVGAALSQGRALAGVPDRLAVATVSAGVGGTGGVSAEVAVLTKGVLGAMSLTKLKVATAALFLVCLLGAGAGAALLSDPASPGEPPKGPPAPLADVAPAQRGDRQSAVVERGSVKAAVASDLACGLERATVRWVLEDGARVKKGDRLVVLDDTPLRDQLHEQRVMFDQAVAAKTAAGASLARIQKENHLDTRAGEVEVKLARLEVRKNASKDPVEREILELKVEQALIRLDRGKLRGEAREARATSDLNAKAVALARETARKGDLEARLASCVLLAPHDGMAVHFVPDGPRRGPASLLAVGDSVQGRGRSWSASSAWNASSSSPTSTSRRSPVSALGSRVRIDAFPKRFFLARSRAWRRCPPRRNGPRPTSAVYPVEVGTD